MGDLSKVITWLVMPRVQIKVDFTSIHLYSWFTWLKISSKQCPSPQLMGNKGDFLIYLYIFFYLLPLKIQNES
ncbi:unnamed protein product [Rotaria magnacalcarata]